MWLGRLLLQSQQINGQACSLNMQKLTKTKLLNKYDYEAQMTLSIQARQDLVWVLENLRTSSAPVHCPKPDYIIYTDASSAGWGCFDPQTKKKGGSRWTAQEQTNHINYLEIKAILCSLCQDKREMHIRVMTDNTTALTCVNKQG